VIYLKSKTSVISGPISIGTGMSVITPPIGVELCGYGVYLRRNSTGIHDDLCSKALIIEGKDRNRIAIISNELVGLSEEVIERSKDLISTKIDIDKNNILVTCTHTHSGPATTFMRGWGKMDAEYLKKLPDEISNSAVKACENLKPAQIGFGKGKVSVVSFNRVEKDGPTDSSVGVIKIDNPSGDPLAILFNFACHPVSIDNRTPAGTLISRDWPGHAIDMISSELRTNSIFLQGTTGDIDPVVAWHNFQFEGAALTGHIIGSKTIEIIKEIKTSKIKQVSLKKKDIELPLRFLTEEEVDSITQNEKQKNKQDKNWVWFYDDWNRSMKEKLRAKPCSNMLKSEIALLKIEVEGGEGAIIFLPGEVFVRLGLSIKKNSPFGNTFIAGYYGRYIGYIPDKFNFEREGYAATLVPRIVDFFPYEKNVGETLVQEVKNLSQEAE
jgi:hypothetical protein